MNVDSIPNSTHNESMAKSALWLAPLTTASILATLAKACATPFAALGALAAHLRSAGGVLRSLGALLTAMMIFKATIYGFGLVLGGNQGAFTLPVVARFCETNLIAFAGLLMLHRVGIAIGLASRHAPLPATVAH